MYLYVYEGFSAGEDRQSRTAELIQRAVKSFSEETGMDFTNMSREICRTENGKPYFKEIPVRFSVSHTDDIWVCLMSDRKEPVGVDIQIMKSVHYEKVAERYFTADEKAELVKNGENAFFKIWVRKEAYSKYTGKGLTRNLAEVSTINNAEVKFIDFHIRAGVKGSCCVKEEGELCLRMI